MLAMRDEGKDERRNRAWMERGRDEVAQEHQAAHGELQRWGLWQRERYQQGVCASLEHNFDNSGGRTPSRAIVSLPPDPRLAALEAAIVAMQIDRTPVIWSGRYLIVRKPRRGPGLPEEGVMVLVEQMGETLAEYYAKRWPPRTICWAHALQYEDFAKWMYDCRAMVIRRLGSAT